MPIMMSRYGTLASLRELRELGGLCLIMPWKSILDLRITVANLTAKDAFRYIAMDERVCDSRRGAKVMFEYPCTSNGSTHTR